MFFSKKNNSNLKKCEECGNRSEKKFSFCPYCGNNFIDLNKEKKDYGLLGKRDVIEEETMFENFGIMDKLLNSMVNSMMKNLDKQFKEQFKEVENMEKTEIKSFPNGIRIKISGPIPVQKIPNKTTQKTQTKNEKKEINESQLKKMESFPRAKAKSSVKRYGDKVVYELVTPGVVSPEDVFVSKLESGYEIKAIGENKIYVNSVPIELPLKKFSVLNDRLLIEFAIIQ